METLASSWAPAELLTYSPQWGQRRAEVRKPVGWREGSSMSEGKGRREQVMERQLLTTYLHTEQCLASF